MCKLSDATTTVYEVVEIYGVDNDGGQGRLIERDYEDSYSPPGYYCNGCQNHFNNFEELKEHL